MEVAVVSEIYYEKTDECMVFSNKNDSAILIESTELNIPSMARFVMR